MERNRILPILFWIGFSLLVMSFSYKLGLGGFHNPGPGFMPFLVGLLLFVISFYPLIKFLCKTGGETNVEEKRSQANLKKIALVVGSLFAYALLLENLGYLITTSLLLFLLFSSMGSKKWWSALMASVLTALVTYYGFTFFGVLFPAGIWKF